MATDPIIIQDDHAGYSLDKFVVPPHYEDSLESVLIPNGIIRDRIERIAMDIHQDYAGKPIHFLCVLKGAHQFFGDVEFFMKRLHRYNGGQSQPYSEDFIKASSYDGDQSKGDVKITGIDLAELKGEQVLIIEDIIDTGKTMDKLLKKIRTMDPASLKVASLLLKRTEKREVDLHADYAGFEIPDHFVVGYCLDYNQNFRDLDHICVINDKGKEKYKIY